MKPLFLLLFALLAIGGCGADARSAQAPEGIAVKAEAVPLSPADPNLRRLGAFTYAGGLWLMSSGTKSFGGFSDLKVDARGDLVSETDFGALMHARLVLDEKGRLEGLDHATLAPLTGEDGHPLDGKSDSDSEGVAIWPDGDLMVSFERNHRIWIYPARGGPPKPAPMPPISMPDNEGMEGLALAPSREPDAYWVGVEGGSIWLCRLARDCQRWPGLPTPPLGYRLTALAETPAGDLVVLHHSFNPLTSASRVLATIVGIPPSPRAPARPKAQLELAPPLTVDNFEGVSAVTSPNGGLRLYLISDDNFSDKQRTLLLAFDLPARKVSGKGRHGKPH